MMIFKKSIPRRSFLRGVGASIALPFLDSMVPAFAAPNSAAAPVRMGFVYVPNGIIMEKWTPAVEGAKYDLTPTLEPLAAFRNNFLVLSGLDLRAGFPLPGDLGAGHSRTTSAYLTSVHPKSTEGADIQAGISVDQIAAREMGRKTQLASLEMALDPIEASGVCEQGWACAYRNTIAWRSPNTPLPVEDNPRAIFERLFGDSDTTDPTARLERIHENRSLLDSLAKDATQFVSGLGSADRLKVVEYLDAVRDVERRIQLAEEQSAREIPSIERPAGIPASMDDYSNLMFDLLLLALQTDLTRVFTFMIGHENSNKTYPQVGVVDPHHPLTHHRGDHAMIAKVEQINRYHVHLFSYFMEKLRATPDGDGSLLDHMMVSYGAGMSDANNHSNVALPAVLAGGAGGKIKGGRHLRYKAGTPFANLQLAMLDMAGIQVENFGDSTGKLDLLSLA